ncbi:MAG TPA: EamA/RhaT family transporter, partial [Arenimonas sp.]|nr:EamA/RhaT family transporter [Arenimonas sp.]
MAGNSNLRGILAMLLAIGLLSLMDVGLKTLARDLPAMQVAALRGLTSLPLVLLWVLASGAWSRLWKVRWSLHLLRGVLS